MVSDPVIKDGIIGNLGLAEVLTLGGAAFATYKNITQHKDNLTLFLTIIPAGLMANSALASKNAYASGSKEGFNFGNFDLFELATAGALIWAGLRYMNLHDDVPAAIGCWIGAAAALFFGGKGEDTYL